MVVLCCVVGGGGVGWIPIPPRVFWREERQGGLDTPPGASFGERMRDRHACETETLCASQTHNQSSRPRKRQICGTETRLCQPNNSGVCSGLIHGAHVCLYTYPPENSPICSAPTRPRACCAGPPAKAQQQQQQSVANGLQKSRKLWCARA